ncbi:MAG TPA: hypothetical protein VF833_03690 [Gaiellaceae bacterium]
MAFIAAALAALAVCGSAAATPDCASRLLADWRDGRMDRVYPVDCYREALASLPEDLRIYSSAETDITRAMQARVRTVGVTKAAASPKAAAAPKTDGGHQGVSPFVILAVTAGLVLGVGSLLVYVR